MSIERGSFHANKLQELKSVVTAKGFELVAPILRLSAENIIRKTEVEYEDGFEQHILEARQRGDVLLFVTNHQSLADTVVSIKPLRRVRRLLDGELKIALPYTKLVTTGDKGDNVKGFSDTLDQTLRRDGIEPVLIVREQDEKLGVEGNYQEARVTLEDRVKEGYDVLIHAEGKLDAARINPETGQRNGMQPLVENSLRSIILIAKRLDKGVTIVPITISGSYNIYDPARGEIDPKTQQPRGALTRNAVRVGFNRSDASLANIYVSNPMRVCEGELGDIRTNDRHNWNRFNSVVGRKIASHLPSKMRGVYA